MISHRYRCIFIHIPRCGGSSIEDVIWRQDERTEANLWMGFERPMHNRHQTGGLQHLLARQVRSEVGQQVFGAYFKFAFVRNPWNKAVSQFSYTMQSRPDLREFANIRANASFAEYLECIRRVKHVQWEQQVKFLQDESGRRLVDYVGRFESLARDAQVVFSRLGIAVKTVPHVNRADRAGFDGFTAETRDVVARMYAADIATFDYSCPWPL